MGFVHLHCHSGFSLLEGTTPPQQLVAAAKKAHMPALAITDRNNLYGVVHFYLHAQKAGIKPVIGMEVDLDDGSSLVLLARNLDGYRNLAHLATSLRLNADPEGFPPSGFEDEDPILPWEPGLWGVPVFGFTDKPTPATAPRKEARLPKETLLSGRHVRGLVALSGGRHGLVNSLVAHGKTQAASRAAGMLLSAFGEGNFFIEIQSLGGDDMGTTRRLVDLANNLGIPIVATNDVLYLEPEDAPTALALAAARRGKGAFRGPGIQVEPGGAIKAHPDLQSEVDTERYFRSAEEMAELFSDYPQAIANARFIAEQCNVELPLHKPIFPGVDLSGETPFSKLWKLCFAGATRRYRPLTGEVISRLKQELEVIEILGFCPYFLVVYDIANFARAHDIPIMARGSAANSLVAYVLGITQVDPLAHDLLFERFLNTSRAEFEMPDIDLDLCWRRRDEVLHYVYDHFGRDHVAIVGTHITFRLRSAWREMAKALGINPDRVSRVANRLSDIASEIEAEEIGDEDKDWGQETEGYSGAESPNPSLRDETERAAFGLAQSIEGLPRHAGMHCGGVVIAPGPLADIVPLQRAARDPSMAITQFEKDAIESLGLVKMDLLGSRALTTLVDSLQASGLAKGIGDVHKALEQIPLDDEQTYRLMAEANTIGCFQLESPGMRGLLKWLRPRSMNDITAAISLFRPGPMEGGFLEIFMRRHLRQEPVSYPHPSMEPILKDTYGVILYQEQFLKLAHVLAGVDLGEAEKLRKDLGKARTPDERARLGSWFVAGAIERGIDQLQAEKVWEVVSGYTGFGFCKAHACSYAINAYRSAYMKTHYPAHYMAAQINNMGGYYGTRVYVEDARRQGVEILPPHVNLSGALCEVPLKTRSIRFGLQFIKGLSEKTIAALLLERRNNGPFRSLPDLMARVEMTPPEVTALVKAGACDGLGVWEQSFGVEPECVEESWASRVFAQPLNRRQLLWLLPSLLSVRRARARGAIHKGMLEMMPTGSDGLSVQIMMGEVLSHNGGPRILGSANLRMEVPDMEDLTPAEKLRLEEEAIGFVLSSNEMEMFKDLAEERGAVPARRLAQYAGREVAVAGVLAAGRSHTTKQGERMLFVTLQDCDGLVETVLFPETYKDNAEVLANGGHGPYLVRGLVQVSGKGRGIGIQPPADLRPADSVTMKMHPVVIVSKVEPLSPAPVGSVEC